MKLLPFFIFCTLLVACNDNQEDTVNQIDKTASIESIINVDHAETTTDVIVTKYNIWKNNQLVKEIVHYDTIPALESTMQKKPDNGSTNENEMVSVRKDYEVYITVK